MYDYLDSASLHGKPDGRYRRVFHCIGGVVMRLVIIAIGLLSIAALEPRAVSAQSTAFAYAPGTQKYRLITEVHREQAQGGGRAPFEFDVTTTQFVTMNLI